MKRQLGITWKAAWLLKHKLMEVMVQREAKKPLQGDVSEPVADLDADRRTRSHSSLPLKCGMGDRNACDSIRLRDFRSRR